MAKQVKAFHGAVATREKPPKPRTSRVAWGCGCLIAVLMLSALIGNLRDSQAETRSRAQREKSVQASSVRSVLAYLGTRPDVVWYEIERNNVYIGFSSTAEPDWLMATRMAAYKGNKATSFGFHAWAADARVAREGWRPDRPGYICSVTFRHGELDDTDCP